MSPHYPYCRLPTFFGGPHKRLSQLQTREEAKQRRKRRKWSRINVVSTTKPCYRRENARCFLGTLKSRRGTALSPIQQTLALSEEIATVNVLGIIFSIISMIFTARC